MLEKAERKEKLKISVHVTNVSMCRVSIIEYNRVTLICRFIVMQNNVMKYITNIGQNTGMLNTSKNVQTIPITVLFEIAYQNLNSGNRRMNGRNSSFDLVGSSGP